MSSAPADLNTLYKLDNIRQASTAEGEFRVPLATTTNSNTFTGNKMKKKNEIKVYCALPTTPTSVTAVTTTIKFTRSCSSQSH